MAAPVERGPSQLLRDRVLTDHVSLDVDTPEPDEKSLITYISSLYDVFPNPPALHPLYDPVTRLESIHSVDV